jgi:molecular chaperone DnaK
MGASVMAGKLSGVTSENSAANELLLMDVTPLSLSIETVGGIATRLIPRNTTIPAKHSRIFTTAANFQSTVEIKVYQGERQFVKDNTLLGSFKLSGIKRALAGVPQIEVTFDINVDGILTVYAKDLGTGKTQQVTISSKTYMSEAEIQRAIKEAEYFEQSDTEEAEQAVRHRRHFFRHH